jgi:hypothetical protein
MHAIFMHFVRNRRLETCATTTPKTVSARELFGLDTDRVGEVDGFLIDDSLLESEHERLAQDERGEGRKETEESRTTAWRGRLVLFLLSTFSSLLSIRWANPLDR